jgi:broad specificity phosphatase PhoE
VSRHLLKEGRFRERDMTSRITFISHAVTPALRRAAFPIDEALEEGEIARVQSMGWKAPGAQQILSAPERRAQMTGLSLDLSASITEDLRDCDFGSWGGRELSQVQDDDPAGLVSWLTDPAAVPHGGESIQALVGRVKGWLDRQRDAGHTIAVTHPSIIRSAMILALDAPLQSFWRVDIAPISLTDLRYNGSTWTLRSAATKLSQTE